MVKSPGLGVVIASIRSRVEIRRALANLRESEMAQGTIAADELRLLIERIERGEEEKKEAADHVRDIYAEAKSRGFDTKTMRAIVKLRKMETHDRQESEAMIETYKAALGLD